jgi:hypothetical protein
MAYFIGVLLSVLGTSARAAGTTPLPEVAQQRGVGTGVLHLAATQASCGQLRTRCVSICARRYRPASSEAAACRGECILDYRACMYSVLYGTKRS